MWGSFSWNAKPTGKLEGLTIVFQIFEALVVKKPTRNINPAGEFMSICDRLGKPLKFERPLG